MAMWCQGDGGKKEVTVVCDGCKGQRFQVCYAEGTGTGGCRIAPPSAIGSAGYGIGNGSDEVATLVQADLCSSCGCGCLVEYCLMEVMTTRSGRDTRYVLGIKRRVFQANVTSYPAGYLSWQGL